MLGRWLRRAALAAGAVLLAVVVIAGAYAGGVALGARAGVASADGTVAGLPVDGPVTIARDVRGVPHIRAGSLHDLMVADGYAMASDRLFQMDLTRRYVDGRLAEVLGPPLAAVDRRMRRYAIRDLAARVYAGTPAGERALLDAFAAGVNAAATHEPAPPEYRALFFGFEPWKPEDALAVGFATVLDLDDRPDDVVARDRVRRLLGPAGTDALYPLTDPKYDVPADGTPPGPLATLPPLPPLRAPVSPAVELAAGLTAEAPPVGSNGWVAGGGRTTNGKAVLANDPHLDIGVPGIWWLVEGRAPGVHIAGAALAGTPGVTLGHNEHLAWGVTAGEAMVMRVIRERTRSTGELLERGGWVRPRHRHERIGVRLGPALDADIEETAAGTVIARDAGAAYLMDWRMRRTAASPLAPFLALLRARSSADGVAAMRALPEPALNVLFADDAGRAAYHFAGAVPLEANAGRWASDPAADEPAYLAYDAAPRVAPSRDALVVSSNNRPDGASSPRLAPFWPPPYRAFEIRRALAESADIRGKLSPDALAVEQRDATSPAEREFADLVLAAVARENADGDPASAAFVAALHGFDGTLVPESRGATAVVALRREMVAAILVRRFPRDLVRAATASGPGFEIVLRALRERPRGWVPHDDYDAFVVAAVRHAAARLHGDVPTFGAYAAQPLEHALAPFGLRVWNGTTMPGRGGSYAPAVQWDGHAQSFRAVWIAGDWDASTIDIDAGESGEPGSPHYLDQTNGWIAFARTPLPFSDAAVRAATRHTLTLTR